MKIQEAAIAIARTASSLRCGGPVRSMPLEAVRAEAQRLAAAGYPEIVVTGIHLASYGRGTPYGLLDAIEAVHLSARRVRLGSWNP